MTRTADPRPPYLGWALFLVLPVAFWLWAVGSGRADAIAYRAVAMSCPASIQGPDCSADTALDVVSQPAGETECPKVAQVLATHLDLPPGAYHKLRCERRKPS